MNVCVYVRGQHVLYVQDGIGKGIRLDRDEIGWLEQYYVKLKNVLPNK